MLYRERAGRDTEHTGGVLQPQVRDGHTKSKKHDEDASNIEADENIEVLAEGRPSTYVPSQLLCPGVIIVEPTKG